MQQKIDRELKEIEECTKDLTTKRKKDDNLKKIPLKFKVINVDRVINFCKQQKQTINNKDYNPACSKFANMSCETNFVKSSDRINNKLLNVRNRIINDEMSAVTKLVS